MRIECLSLQGFRNISSMEFRPCPGVNVIYGDNAQGKTNLLEAVWLFTGARSFRGARDSDYLPFGEDRAALNLQFFAGQRSQSAEIVFAKEKKLVRLNEIKQSRIRKLAGEFCAVVFSPDDLSMVKEGPERRRRMIDTSLCQTYPKYAKILDGYEKSLRQRNRLLKDIPGRPALADTLDAWDLGLAEYGAYISRMRARYIRRLDEIAREIYAGISLDRERFSATYVPSIEMDTDSPDQDRKAYVGALEQALRKARTEDLRTGTTSVGPHRDDLLIKVNGISARSFGSQGQQRSCVLALKLAECRILEERWGEPPVILLDDVMSELDQSRRAYLLGRLTARQVLITCCDASVFGDMETGAVFQIEGGSLIEQKSVS